MSALQNQGPTVTSLALPGTLYLVELSWDIGVVQVIPAQFSCTADDALQAKPKFRSSPQLTFKVVKL